MTTNPMEQDKALIEELRKPWFTNGTAELQAKAAARIAELSGMVARNMTDTQRLVWKDEAQSVCSGGVDCFEYGDHVRCGPCAAKLAMAAGIEPNTALPGLPEVSRLKREAKEQALAYLALDGQAIEALDRVKVLEAENARLRDVGRMAAAWLDGFDSTLGAFARAALENSNG